MNWSPEWQRAAEQGVAAAGRPELRFPRRGRGFMFVGGRRGRAPPWRRPPLNTWPLGGSASEQQHDEGGGSSRERIAWGHGRLPVRRPARAGKRRGQAGPPGNRRATQLPGRPAVPVSAGIMAAGPQPRRRGRSEAGRRSACQGQRSGAGGPAGTSSGARGRAGTHRVPGAPTFGRSPCPAEPPNRQMQQPGPRLTGLVVGGTFRRSAERGVRRAAPLLICDALGCMTRQEPAI
jgi:hypothetical protein